MKKANRTVNLKISVSGVRGIAGETLTPSLVANFAIAFGQYIDGGRVVVGRDTRIHGKMFEHAVISGLISVGCKPIILGITPTPTVQIAVEELKANGGIVISASHNPVEWNALKFIGRSGVFLSAIEGAELLDIYNQPENQYSPEAEFKEVHFFDKAFDIHKERIFKNISLEAIKKHKFKVAIDACNGAGAPFSQRFLEELGCQVFPINTEITGKFNRKPEPNPENLDKLIKMVQENSCNIGFAQDPDADRLSVVDENGAPLGEQLTFSIALSQILSRKKGNVVVNLDTTKMAEGIVKNFNSRLYYSKIGEINVIAEMKKRNAVAGGEGGSGGIIWPAVHHCRDSFVGMALFLELLAEKETSISQIAKEMPQFFMARRKIPIYGTTSKAMQIIRKLGEKYSSLNPNMSDGIRIDWDNKWILARASNTEPVIRITAEAKTQDEANGIADLFENEIRKYSQI
ncbi:MAG: phosphoglucosamine mutase [Candidatus Nanoarchaeia archaeon]